MRKVIVAMMVFGLMAAASGVAFAAFSSNGSGSATVAASTLQAPTGGNTSGPTSSSLTISWIAPASGPAPTGYKVVRNGTTNTCASSLTSTATSCTDTGLIASTTYNYEIFSRIANNWLSAGKATASGTTSAAVGALAQFAVSASSPQAANAPFSLTVTAQDSSGNTVTSFSGTRTFNITGGSIGPDGVTAPTSSATATFTNGTGTLSITLVKVETIKVTATEAVAGGKSGQTGNIAVNPGSASKVAWMNVAGTASNASVSTPCMFTCTVSKVSSGTVTFQVSITDSSGNVVNDVGAGKTVTLSTSGGSFNPTGAISLPATGAATTSSITYNPPSGSWTSTTSTASSTGFTTTGNLTANKG